MRDEDYKNLLFTLKNYFHANGSWAGCDDFELFAGEIKKRNPEIIDAYLNYLKAERLIQVLVKHVM